MLRQIAITIQGTAVFDPEVRMFPVVFQILALLARRMPRQARPLGNIAGTDCGRNDGIVNYRGLEKLVASDAAK